MCAQTLGFSESNPGAGFRKPGDGELGAGATSETQTSVWVLDWKLSVHAAIEPPASTRLK